METMKINCIVPAFGSDRMQSPIIGRELGDCEWLGIPFAGGMSVVLHAQARTIILNDLHRHVINLARTLADRSTGPALYRKLRRYVLHPDAVVISQARCEIREQNLEREFDLFSGPDRNIARQIDPSPDLLWAEDYFVSAWMSRSHHALADDEFSTGISLRWNANGGDSAARYRNAVSGLKAWRKIFRDKNCSFSTIDALLFLETCKDQDRHSIYCDPPFPGAGDRYKFKVDERFQKNLAAKVATFEHTRVVMRFYDHPLIRELYPESHWTWCFNKGRTQANKDAPEILLLNGPSFAGGAIPSKSKPSKPRKPRSSAAAKPCPVSDEVTV